MERKTDEIGLETETYVCILFTDQIIKNRKLLQTLLLSFLTTLFKFHFPLAHAFTS